MTPQQFSLPFDCRPDVMATQFDAFYLGIKKANDPAYENELFNDYGQVMYIEPMRLNFCTSWLYSPRLFSFFEIKTERWQSAEECDDWATASDLLVDYTKKMLRLGYYVQGFWNDRHIPGKEAYQIRDYVHDYLIYGFDDERKVFLSAGYVYEKYQPFTVEYETFVRAVTDTQVFMTTIRFEKPLPEFYNQELNKEKIYLLFRAYIESENIYGESCKSLFYGVDAVKKLLDEWENNDIADLIDLRLLAEMRSINMRKAQRLIQEGCIHSPVLVNKMKELYDESVICMNKAIKAILQGKNVNRELIEKQNTILTREQEYIECLMEQMEQCCDFAYLRGFDFATGECKHG